MNIADRVNSSAIKDNRLRSCEAHADIIYAVHAPDECVRLLNSNGQMARPTLYLFTAPGDSASGVTTAFGQLSLFTLPSRVSRAPGALGKTQAKP